MSNNNFSVAGHILDVVNRRIVKGEVCVSNGFISEIKELEQVPDQYILPGLVDSHVHIESSMLIPSQFARLVVRHGTLAVVTDPHEIANVLGEIGVDFMINDARKTPLKICFGVPSCVPATIHETSGFILDSNVVESLLKRDEVVCLAEVMDFMGVVNDDLEVCRKIKACKKLGKKVDGHAPGLKGNDLRKYAAAGVGADHECSTLDEALEKISLGMMIQIREGSAAKDFEALYSLIDSHPQWVMLCTDDAHPDDLLHGGHMNKLIRRGLEKGLDLFNLLRAATCNPVRYYHLDMGLLQVNDSADFIVIDNPVTFNVQEAYIQGSCVFRGGEVLFSSHNDIILNNFSRRPISLDQIQVPMEEGVIHAIGVSDGDLITGNIHTEPSINGGFVTADIERDLLKIVVLSRYDNRPPVVGFVQGFGFIRGAIAESIAHDSHNIIAVGTNDHDLFHAINRLIEMKGGLVAVSGSKERCLPLEVAGLMSNDSPEEVADAYEQLSDFVNTFGSSFHAPYMTLAFMSLLVIPKLKLSDKGLFDVEQGKVISLFHSLSKTR